MLATPPLRPRCTPAVASALAHHRPVVALESSVLAQGLAVPHNHDAAARMTRAVREAGAVPAITAVVRGEASCGLEDDDLARFLARDGVRKVSARDLAWCMADRADGATTVAATLAIAPLAGIELFATGGIGGVHRDPPFDESADLVELARQPMIVVCAGAKSILDLPATLERLETLGVTVIGWRTDEWPGFFTARTGLAVPSTATDASQVADAWRHHRALGRPGAFLVVQPPPAEAALEPALVEDATRAALDAARAAGVRGAATTPFLLAEVERRTGGRSVHANLALLEANAALAGALAVALADTRSTPDGSRRGNATPPAPP